jgi:hypothetical protein
MGTVVILPWSATTASIEAFVTTRAYGALDFLDRRMLVACDQFNGYGACHFHPDFATLNVRLLWLSSMTNIHKTLSILYHARKKQRLYYNP